MPAARGVPINGSAIRAIREARGINISTLATDATISTSFLSNIEAGRKVRVSPEVRRQIADRLQCPVDAISFVGATAADPVPPPFRHSARQSHNPVSHGDGSGRDERASGATRKTGKPLSRRPAVTSTRTPEVVP